MNPRLKGLGLTLASLTMLAACANDPDSGASADEARAGYKDLPAMGEIQIPEGAVRAAGDGNAKCDPKTTVAYVGAVTGPNAQLGINIYKGAELALKEHNDANPDCQVAFTKLDTEGDPNKATGPVSQVVNDENVVAVLGLPFSGESKATGQILEEAGMPHITPSATNPGLTEQGWTTFFRALGNDNVQGPAAADLTAAVGADKVYVIQDDSDYGIGLGAAAIEALGDRLVGTDKVTTAQKDFSATVAKVINAKPDAVFYAGYYAEAAPLDQQLVSKGFEGLFVGPDGVKDQQFINLAGDSSNNSYFTCPCAPGELIPEFAAAYEDLNGEPSGTYSVEAYDVMTIFLTAIDAGNTTREDILKFLQDYSGQGLGKFYEWDETGELAELPVFGYKVEDGKVVSVGPIE